MGVTAGAQRGGAPFSSKNRTHLPKKNLTMFPSPGLFASYGQDQDLKPKAEFVLL